jgi:hypothetical protein
MILISCEIKLVEKRICWLELGRQKAADDRGPKDAGKGLSVKRLRHVCEEVHSSVHLCKFGAPGMLFERSDTTQMIKCARRKRRPRKKRANVGRRDGREKVRVCSLFPPTNKKDAQPGKP